MFDRVIISPERKDKKPRSKYGEELMTKLKYLQVQAEDDRATKKILFQENDSRRLGLWMKALKASIRLTEADRPQQIADGFYFDFKRGEEGAIIAESSSFLDLIYDAGIEENEEEHRLFIQMVDIAIQKGILVDVTGWEGVQTEEGYRSYAFKEVLATIESYLKIDHSKVFGGVKRHATEEVKNAMDRAKQCLLEMNPSSRDDINEFCSTYVKDNPTDILEKDRYGIQAIFLNTSEWRKQQHS